MHNVFIISIEEETSLQTTNIWRFIQYDYEQLSLYIHFKHNTRINKLLERIPTTFNLDRVDYSNNPINIFNPVDLKKIEFMV